MTALDRFSVGAIVYLKSGSPPMVVAAVDGSSMDYGAITVCIYSVATGKPEHVVCDYRCLTTDEVTS